jgi:hypothetical protein
MSRYHLFVLLFFLSAHMQSVVGQNNTNSPYTRFGFGDISDTNNGEQRAMGGVSIASRSKTSINSVNPASYSSVDSLTFMFDLGASALGSRFSENSRSNYTFNSNLEYLSMQFPITKWMGFSAGLLPYSFVGYAISSSDTILSQENDSITTIKNFSGMGGFSQVYTGLSINLFNHIALGLNAYYMYGTIQNRRQLSINTTNAYNSSLSSSIRADNFRYRLGAQFYNTFAKKHDLNLGFIFEQKAPMNTIYTQSSTGALATDSIKSFDFETPTIMGVGLHYCYDNKFSLGVDYSLHKWDETKNFYGASDSLVDRSKIAFGAEYIPNSKGRKLSDRMRYRGGFNLSNPYVHLAGSSPSKNFGINFGFGIPLKNTKTMLNTSFEYGKVGTSSLLKEDYFKITFNAVFNEYWFFKRKL